MEGGKEGRISIISFLALQLQVTSVLRQSSVSSEPPNKSLLDELKVSLEQFSEGQQVTLKSADSHVTSNDCVTVAQSSSSHDLEI